MTLDAFLQGATSRLGDAGILTARLDAQVLAAYVLDVDRAWLLAHGDYQLTTGQAHVLEQMLAKRVARIPLAYLFEHWSFYGRLFDVTPAVLIPRPETETLVEHLIALSPKRILDVGTGSGAIAITAALELPDAQVSGCDISESALAVAHQNTDKFEAPVEFFTSNLLARAKGRYDAVIANLPYVDRAWECSPETNAEPELALFADDHGLALIKKLIAQAPGKLSPKGYLLLEADPRQHAEIIKTAAPTFSHVKTDDFALIFRLA